MSKMKLTALFALSLNLATSIAIQANAPATDQGQASTATQVHTTAVHQDRHTAAIQLSTSTKTASREAASGKINVVPADAPLAAKTTTNNSLIFTPNTGYTTGAVTVNNQTVAYRAYKAVPYVANPVDAKYENMNIYIPENYFHNKPVGNYTKDTAPIFFPNTVGGYMPGEAGTLEARWGNTESAEAYALCRGYIIAAPGARGRSLIGDDGRYTGKAPAGIVDLQAAVAYLHANDAVMPGNADRIVSNGGSAGGAYSLLVGAAGNSQDMKPYLEALGAANDRTDIFAVSAFCPITNLDHADMAYEWSYNGVNEYAGGMMMAQGQLPLINNNPSKTTATVPQLPKINNGSATAVITPGQTTAESTTAEPKIMGNKNRNTAKKVALTKDQMAYSKMLKTAYASYVNSLQLKDANGQLLTLNTDGTGTFFDYAKSFIIKSAEAARQDGIDISKVNFLMYDKNDPSKMVDVDWLKYNKSVGRMKTPGAFDSRDNSTGENNEFGTTTMNNLHFTDTAALYATDTSPARADQHIVNMMNAMYYLGNSGATNAKHWRIRYGEADSNTSFSIPLMVAVKAANLGYDVDFALPWGVDHKSDYDLKNMFDWIDKVVAEG